MAAPENVTPKQVRSYFQAQNKTVVTFAGYSGGGYQDLKGMLAKAEEILKGYDPKTTIVNAGASFCGIGAVYSVAKKLGFPTTGIISSKANNGHTRISWDCEVVFYVNDRTYGGFMNDGKTLSPTSFAMVENSDVFIALGGGPISRDEYKSAKLAGKKVQFFPFDVNHSKVIKGSQARGQPIPTDFSSVVATVA